MSKFPSELDNDSTLPGVIDGGTENSGTAINALKDAVLAIQQAIGTDPQGSTADLVARLAVSIGDNGTLKSSALLAAGLVALPITNSQISSSAAISESKLNLDFATLALHNQLTSHSIDIDALQQAMLELLSNFLEHVNGDDFYHDGYQILLDVDSPNAAPSWLTGFDESTVSGFIAAFTSDYDQHKQNTTGGAHFASGISVENNFSTINSTNVQDALEQIESLRAIEIVEHQDSQHSNGISLWENSTDGYNVNARLVPSSGTASFAVIDSRIIDLNVDASDISIGSVFVSASGLYTVVAVGFRPAAGGRPSLSTSQIELARSLPVSSGFVVGALFGKSSTSNLKATLAISVLDGGGSQHDSIVAAAPNVARIVSLGILPNFIDSSVSLSLTAGVGTGLSRTIVLNNLHLDRFIAAGTVTLDSLVARINSLFLASHFPASAYKIGSELAICHNWSGDSSYSLTLNSASNMLGFGTAGADVVGKVIEPAQTGSFYVNGYKLNGFGIYTSQTTTISGNVVSIAGAATLGIKAGQLLNVKTFSSTSPLGSYLISAVGSNSVTVTSTIGTGTGWVTIEGNSLGLGELTGQKSLSEIFVDSDGFLRQSLRGTTNDGISGLKIVNFSDSYQETFSGSLLSIVSTGECTLQIVGSGSTKTFRTSLIGTVKICGASDVDWVEVQSTGSVGAGTATFSVFDHIDEEAFLELAFVRGTGLYIENITDKRLFGTTGIDEIREDVVQAYVETPIAELRSSGVVKGFNAGASSGISPSVDLGYPAGTQLILMRGGVAYIDGVRVVQNSQYVAIPPADGVYTVSVSSDGLFKVIAVSDFSLSEIIEGLAGSVLPLASVTRTSGPVATSVVSVARSISNIDDRVIPVLDFTNNYVGSFASAEAAVAYINNYPDAEIDTLKIVSSTLDNVNLSGLTRSIEILVSGSIGNLTVSSGKVVGLGGIGHGLHVQSVEIEGPGVELFGLHVDSISADHAGTEQTYKFVDCIFDSTVSFANSSISKIEFIGCSGKLDIVAEIDGEIKFSNCNFVSGSTELVTGQGTIDNCSLSDGYLAWSVGSKGLSVNCFKQSDCTDATILSVAGPAVFSNCIWQDISATAPALIVAPDSTFNNSLFKNIVLTAGSTGTDESLLVATILYCKAASASVLSDISGSSTRVTVKAETVSDLTFDSCTAFTKVAVELVANAISNVNEIAKFNLASTDTVAVNQCSFVISSVTDGAFKISAGYSRLNNCSFDFGSNAIALSAIKFIASETSEVYIDNCSFVGEPFVGDFSGYTGGYGLDFLNLTNDPNISPFPRVYLSNCDFQGVPAIKQNSAPLSGVSINLCVMPVVFAVQFASNCEIVNSDIGSYSISGSTENLSLVGNRSLSSGACTLSGAHNNALIVDNRGSLIVNGTLTNSSITGSKGTMMGGVLSAVSNCTFSGCSFDSFTDLSGLKLIGTSVVNCTFDSDIMFNLDGSGVSIDSSVFDGYVVFAGIPSDFAFRFNRGIAANSVVEFASIVSESIISDNIGFSIDFLAGLSGTKVSNNIANSGSKYLRVRGDSCSQSAVSGNIIDQIDFNSASAISSSVTQNICQLMKFASDTDVANYQFVSVVGNTVAGPIKIFDSVSVSGGTCVFQDLLFDANVCSSVEILSGLNSSANVSVSRLVLSGLTADTLVVSQADAEFSGGNVSIESFSILSSTVTDSITLFGSRNDFTDVAMTYEGTLIADTTANSIKIGRQSISSDWTQVNFRNAVMNNVRLATVSAVPYELYNFYISDSVVSGVIAVDLMDGSTGLSADLVIDGVSISNCETSTIRFASAIDFGATAVARGSVIRRISAQGSKLRGISMPGSVTDGDRLINGIVFANNCVFRDEAAPTVSTGLVITHRKNNTLVYDVLISGNTALGGVPAQSAPSDPFTVSFKQVAGVATGGMLMQQLTVSGNSSIGIDIDMIGGDSVNNTLSATNISNNVISKLDISTVQGIYGFTSCGNTMYEAYDISADILENVLFNGDRVYGAISLAADPSLNLTCDNVRSLAISNGMYFNIDISGFTGFNSIKSFLASNNICFGNFVLPAITVFPESEEQARLLNNTIKGNFVCSVAFDVYTNASNRSRVFPWMNTSNGQTGGVVFNGVSSRTVATTNDLAGAGIEN